jgi:hypothetical protein
MGLTVPCGFFTVDPFAPVFLLAADVRKKYFVVYQCIAEHSSFLVELFIYVSTFTL